MGLHDRMEWFGFGAPQRGSLPAKCEAESAVRLRVTTYGRTGAQRDANARGVRSGGTRRFNDKAGMSSPI